MCFPSLVEDYSIQVYLVFTSWTQGVKIDLIFYCIYYFSPLFSCSFYLLFIFWGRNLKITLFIFNTMTDSTVAFRIVHSHIVGNCTRPPNIDPLCARELKGISSLRTTCKIFSPHSRLAKRILSTLKTSTLKPKTCKIYSLYARDKRISSLHRLEKSIFSTHETCKIYFAQSLCPKYIYRKYSWANVRDFEVINLLDNNWNQLWFMI